MEKVDIVIGNPPWITYRNLRMPDYQSRIKRLITDVHKLLPPDRNELLPHMEMATLFYAHCSLRFLKDHGRIGFVMTRSIFTGDQHERFRESAFLPRISLDQVVDLDGVIPLFRFPACVVIGKKEQPNASSPVKYTTMVGRLPKKNVRLAAIETMVSSGKFTITDSELVIEKKGKRTAWTSSSSSRGLEMNVGSSTYGKRFKVGGAMYPRQFWWVDIEQHERFGINQQQPKVVTSRRAVDFAQKAYDGLCLGGNVESQYLFSSLLGADLLPFSHLPFRVVILPIQPSRGTYHMLTRNQVEQIGHTGMSRWLKEVESEWGIRRGDKATKASVYQWLDWGSKVSSQSSEDKWRVLYNNGGSHIASCVLDPVEGKSTRIGGTQVQLNGFIADIKTICFETNSSEEAYYLCSLLNSSVVDVAIKSMQSRGLWGPRDIHKKVFELPIPEFNKGDPTHQALSTACLKCSESSSAIVADFIEKDAGKTLASMSPFSVGRLRSVIRKSLEIELEGIDTLTKSILSE